MRILIVSDTHGRNNSYLEIVEKWKPLDLVVHCGDVEGSEFLVSQAAGCETVIVQGNNDYFSQLPREVEMEIGKYKVMITHGHPYYVNMGHDFLAKEAAARRIDLVMYGHTHRPVIEKKHGVLVMNPGSLTYPRQEGGRPSYIVMEMDSQGEILAKVHYD